MLVSISFYVSKRDTGTEVYYRIPTGEEVALCITVDLPLNKSRIALRALEGSHLYSLHHL